MNNITVWPLICHCHRYAFANRICPFQITCKSVSTKAAKRIEECYQILKLPQNAKQSVVRRAFLVLAKKYHPDSGSPEANIDRFVTIENAFRDLTKHNTGKSSTEEIDKIVFDIKHTAPQHRQYLSYEGVGHGTPSQRMKQWQQSRAQKAAENVMEHRIAKSVASEHSLMKKGQYGKKHDIKTKYGFDRLVEDLIQESMSKGEFENLSGKGKPLKDQNRNPYVDFTTHKLNEVLINNGFTPEWITMNKEIEQGIEYLKKELVDERKKFGPYPLTLKESPHWDRICNDYRGTATTLNMKINKFNLIVPLMNKQRFHVEFDKIAEDILKNGEHSVAVNIDAKMAVKEKTEISMPVASGEDIIGILFKAISEVFSLKKEQKKRI